jgi:hypothetical protein
MSDLNIIFGYLVFRNKYKEEHACEGKVIPVLKHYAMKAYGGVDVEIHIFLTSVLA